MSKHELLDDLERSGLDQQDARKMKLKYLTEQESAAVLNQTYVTHGYLIPYHDVHNKITAHIRVKFLGELLNKKNKQIKYSQPKGSPVHLYYSPNIKWKQILKSHKHTITFTEGEKKSYAACKNGITTIGLSGVWAFRQNKKLIPDFKLINLTDRKVILCFDNDSQTNPEVMRALHTFAKELDEKGAKVFIKHLPFDPYKKIGLDDYLLDHTVEEYNQLPEEPVESLTQLAGVNSQVAYIQTTGKIYIFDHDLFVGARQLCDTVLANNTTVNDKGQAVSIGVSWLQWSRRREHKRLIYAPGRAKVTQDNEYNLWPGWGCTPKEGSIQPFADAVKKIFDNETELIKWFLDWVAYPIQHPGSKMYSAVMLHSVETGTGKSSIGETIGSMYGENFGIVEMEHMESDYNEWAINQQFIMGDEIFGSDKRAAADRFRNLITRTSLRINKKYSPTYKLLDCINYLFNSNHVDMMHLDTEDRRAFVWRIAPGSGITLKQGIALQNFREGKGKQHLLHYFAFEHQISKGFDHRARPPMTEAKKELIDHSMTDIERYLTHVKDNPQIALTLDGVAIDRDLFTVSQVVNLYNRQNPKANVTPTAMGKAISKVFNESRTKVIATQTGNLRLRPLRNFTKWNRASHDEMRRHYDKSKHVLFEAKRKVKKH